MEGGLINEGGVISSEYGSYIQHGLGNKTLTST